MGAPNFLKMLVQEIKQYNLEHMLFVKSGFRYASSWTDFLILLKHKIMNNTKTNHL